ncbi:ATP-dependent DNA/RNA helicase DHX36 [Phymastichus coffea]|uniref:ATP-dependent DNA/RNA helicase DHX36 n=1 Tax=Phymastichus coffea TaxID=108790 RepID=UPI00273C72C2|nr:ATP-dependent DNA/RNA helicase DHX36 [Phymastichus coffea]XP_058808809.1 ATP-dependent DNA/RNA helicase DHX36 [Phymastichus coffea]XP_058808810.1 ATP-dependent DNA/RNA helicase DHX36 [Phymastichus coffea]XP_058808811.1 ATP-dependent DNA/RNA helicase DHX36 [Phymastichus coffea]
MSHRHRGSESRHGYSWRSERSGGFSQDSHGSEMSSGHSYRGSRGGRGGRGGHSPWLKGKEIGLYYKNKQAKKEKAEDKKRETLPIKLKSHTERKIRNLIEIPERPFNKSFNIKQEDEQKYFESRYNHINDSQFKRKFLNIIKGNLQDNLNKALISAPKLRRDENVDIKLLDELNRQKSTNQYRKMLEFRKKLPAYEKQKEILDLIKHNQVILISGETGCGKTTQVAQFILDYEIECGRGSTTCIACTQPRRLSAISVAERVAAERADHLGSSVGFHIRLEKVPARPYGSISFCTTGMLLQFMQMDPALRNYSHIILDEIHERSTQSDFIITLLKQIIPRRPDLKVILMSATLNSEQFSKYYANCPTIHIPGFTYPVEEFYLEDVIALTKFQFPESVAPSQKKKHSKKRRAAIEKFNEFEEMIGPYVRHLEYLKNYPEYVLQQIKNPKSEELSLDLILELTKYICLTKSPGAILIFLPGSQDISKLNRMMIDSPSFPSNKSVIYPLHSRMPTADQKYIFIVPPPDVRKIIIATTIAETSITIEDVVYVIDCGKTKLSNFDVENNMQTLDAEWVSEANAKQRKGRAGRVQPGICYHLYTKARGNAFDRYPLPEMLRTRLEEVILQVKILQIGKAAEFLSTVMDPPNPKAISLSLDLLLQLNALDETENLTPLGYHLAHLPLDPRTGKMILWAAMFSCIEPIFAIAASLSFKDAFYCPLGKEEEARRKKLELGLNQFSDHIALAEALHRFEELNYRGGAYYFCREYFLSYNTLKLLSDMKQQFARYLCEMKFLRNDNPRDDSANRNSHNKSLIKAIVCAGLYPNVAIVKRASPRSGVKAITTEKELVKVHPASINEKVYSFPSPYLTYFLKRKSTGIYLFDTTSVSPVALLFASPTSFLDDKRGKSVITVANNLSFVCEHGTAQIIQKLHKQLDSLLEHKITHPGMITWNGHEGNILNAIIELLSEGDENLGLDSGRYHDWEDFDEDCLDYDD